MAAVRAGSVTLGKEGLGWAHEEPLLSSWLN